MAKSFRRLRHVSSSLVPALFLAACTSSAPSGGGGAPPGPDGGPAVDPQNVHAAFHFTSERDGFASDVQSIVYSDEFHVRVEGLPPGAEVTLTTKTYDPVTQGSGYISEATFAADANGVFDTGTMAPVRGSYEGVDADGPIWSAVAGKVAEGLGPDRQSAYFEAKIGDTVVGTAALGRTYTSDSVKIEKVTQDGLVAELVTPGDLSASQPRIPIVAFGGSEGGISGGEDFAARFASLGYPVLAVAYFGAPGLPDYLLDVPLEYFSKAFDYLDTRSELQKGKAIVMGASRGGELALLLGATFPRVIGVVADAPSSYRWGGTSPKGGGAWTFGGTEMAFVPQGSFSAPKSIKTPDGKSAEIDRSIFENDMNDASPTDLEAARIQVEKTNGPILMSGGAADDLWPSCNFIDRANTHLSDSGHIAKYGDESTCFDGAGHAIGVVGLPTTGLMFAKLENVTLSLGGTAAAIAHAGRAHDKKVRAFLDKLTK